MNNPNIWIAEDPTQPGTAFAAHATHDMAIKYVEETLKEWEEVYGVKGRLVNKEDALRMIEAWDKSKSTMVKRTIAEK